MAKFSDAFHNALEKPFYQIIHKIYPLETIYKIVPYRLGKPKTFLDQLHEQPHASCLTSNGEKLTQSALSNGQATFNYL